MTMTKKLLQKELNDFMLAIAESYSDLVISNIPDERFTKLVDAIQNAKDKTLDNLTAVITQLNEEAEREMSPAKLEGPTPSLPRDVKDSSAPVYNAEKSYLEAAERVTSSSSLGSAMFDLGEEEPVEHTSPGLTIAEERRIEAGLPRKLYRPHIHIGPSGKVEVPLNAPVPAPVLSAEPSPVSARELFEQIRVAVTPLLKENNAKVKDIGFKIIALTSQGLALNYDGKPDE